MQNILLAARALGLGATLTTLYLNFEKETEAALGLPPASTPMPCCRSTIQWDVSGWFAVCAHRCRSTKIDGPDLSRSVATPRQPANTCYQCETISYSAKRLGKALRETSLTPDTTSSAAIPRSARSSSTA